MLLVGDRPQWIRVLLVPSNPFTKVFNLLPDGDLDPTNDPIITDPVALRFDAGPVTTTVGGVKVVTQSESILNAAPLPNGSVEFAFTATQVNKLINDCGSFSRRVRLTIGDYTWATGLFEIDGEW